MPLVLLVSDIHANLAALEFVLENAESNGPFDRVWSIGDAVGYGPQPNEVLAKLQELNAACVAGNHEMAALGKIPLEDFNPYARAAAEWTAEMLTAESRDMVEALLFTRTEDDFTLVHGSPRDPIWEYITHAGVAAVNTPYIETAHCVFGHTHVPALFSAMGDSSFLPDHGKRVEIGAGRWFINPGSVGQPRDRDPRAAYALLDTETMTVEFFRVDYPFSETQRLMQEASLPQMLIERLQFGM